MLESENRSELKLMNSGLIPGLECLQKKKRLILNLWFFLKFLSSLTYNINIAIMNDAIRSPSHRKAKKEVWDSQMSGIFRFDVPEQSFSPLEERALNSVSNPSFFKGVFINGIQVVFLVVKKAIKSRS